MDRGAAKDVKTQSVRVRREDLKGASGMDREQEKIALMRLVERCQHLAGEDPDGPTAKLIKNLASELREHLRSLEER